jgi:hypothetical protein
MLGQIRRKLARLGKDIEKRKKVEKAGGKWEKGSEKR